MDKYICFATIKQLRVRDQAVVKWKPCSWKCAGGKMLTNPCTGRRACLILANICTRTCTYVKMWTNKRTAKCGYMLTYPCARKFS